MSKLIKSFAGVLGTLLLGAVILAPQAAEARSVCHRGYFLSHHHCVKIHHHKPHHVVYHR